MNTVITISREIGSGGHVIGELVAKKLGIPFMDKEFIREICKETGIDQKLVEMRDEFGSWSDKYFNYNFYNALYMGDPQDSIFKAETEIILEKANKGPCVIVGRCADYILEEDDANGKIQLFKHQVPQYQHQVFQHHNQHQRHNHKGQLQR